MQIYAATNGFLDRLNVERVPEFLLELDRTDALPAPGAAREDRRAATGRRRPRRRSHDAVDAFAEDFGYDLDEEGQPLDETPRRSASRPALSGQAAAEPHVMASQRDVKNKIASVKNIQKITRAMEMVAAARLRRAEQRIAALRPYADAIRRMTRQAAEAAGAEASRLPLLREHESRVERRAAAGHRRPRARRRLQLADHPRRRAAVAPSWTSRACTACWYATGRRGVSSLTLPRARARAAATRASPTVPPTPTRARSPTT